MTRFGRQRWAGWGGGQEDEEMMGWGWGVCSDEYVDGMTDDKDQPGLGHQLLTLRLTAAVPEP